MTGERLSTTRHLYATVAGTYAEMLPDTRYESPLELGLMDHFIAQRPSSPLPVLDAGCGTGRMLPYLSERGVSNLEGVDLSPEMIAFARANHPDIPLQTADVAALPYAEASVSAILYWYSLIHSTRDEVGSILREAARVLAPGGTVLLGFQAGTGEREVPRAYGHDVTLHGVLHEPQEIAQQLRDAGFEVTATVDRAPVAHERNRQGFVMARSPGGAGES